MPTQNDLPQRLVDTVAQIYSSAGFQLSRPDGLPVEITFIATPAQQPTQHVAVGCFATDPSQLVKMQQLDTFWGAVSQSGAHSAVFVTNSYFDPAVLQAAESVPLQLIDGAGLNAALGQSQPESAQPQPEPVSDPKDPVPGYPPKPESGPDPASPSAEEAPPEKATLEPSEAPQPEPVAEKPGPKGFVAAFTKRTRPKDAGSKPSFLQFGKDKVEDEAADTAQEKEKQPKATPVTEAPMDWSADGASKRKISPAVGIPALICLLATIVLVVLDQFPAERQQLSAWIQRFIIHPVMNPIEGENKPDPKLLKHTPISAIPPVKVTSAPVEATIPKVAEPTLDEVRRLLVHRVNTLEQLKERLFAEELAAEVELLGKIPGENGASFVEQAGGNLALTIKLICDAENDGPRLSTEEQARVLPYLKIEGGQLKQASPDINVFDLLEPPTNLMSVSPSECPERLRLLERRLYVEEALQARRYAQSVAAVAAAAHSTGIDFVAENHGNLDAVIASVVEGRRIDDPTSPYDGHLFKTPEPPADKLGDVKRFLVITNGKLRYHEKLPNDVDVESKFDPEDKSSVSEAVKIAELLLRHTAEQILVNKANRDKSLMPVKGLQ